MSLLTLRQRHFVLWRPARTQPAPALVIGQLRTGAPVTLTGEQQIALTQSTQFPDLWLVTAQDCGLTDGDVYHYWFEVTDAHPARSGQRIRITDPLAWMVDWRLRAPRPSGAEYTDDDRYPAAVTSYRDGTLVPCDGGGETGELVDPAPIGLPPNNRIVIYELPTAWARTNDDGVYQRGVGTFRDVQALVDVDATGANFPALDVTAPGRSYLGELGVNAVELLPPADSFYARTWGYGTTNFLAPDYELGFPADSSYPTPNRDLRALVAALHEHGIRFFVDSVLAFAKVSPYLAAATDDFFILDPDRAPSSDPDRYNSRGGLRNGFGSTLFRYETRRNGYDPLTGTQQQLSPASALMRTALVRWMNDFHVDGIRLDSIENVFSWDFVGAYRDLARELWVERCGAAQPGDTGCEARFLVVGEELTEPLALLGQRRLDGLWHESFMRYVRAVVLGRSVDGFSFAETVRRVVDCRAFGYSDLAQAVIYLTSHDVEGFQKERLFNYLQSNGVIDCEKRVKLAFACLLTAVGIPQILAGDEFADQHDLFDSAGNVTEAGNKQVDPVNYVRLGEDWRRRIKEYVARLIRLRTTHDGLAVNDVEVIHVDLDGKQVIAWRRGVPGSDQLVVVLANFSDYATPPGPSAEYVVQNWPGTPPGRRWREVTQDRPVPPEWVGREPIFSWEAKVYATA